ncbi:MAG: hypothetical protein E6Q97_37915 [Desulfurellales bacterium]|nr:MAG: hypothetical protein E6Q97_37915 [Desulfurellales bacterium]
MKAKILRLRLEVREFPDGRREVHIHEPDRGKPQYLARLRKWKVSASQFTRDPITAKMIANLIEPYLRRP